MADGTYSLHKAASNAGGAYLSNVELATDVVANRAMAGLSEEFADTQATPAPAMLTFCEMEGALATIHRIAPHKRTPFQSRVRNLQRLGVCPGPGRGKGSAAHFGVEQVMQMAFALEFMQAGVQPEKIASIMPDVWPRLWGELTSTDPARWAIFGLNFLSALANGSGVEASLLIRNEIGLEGLRRALILDMWHIRYNVLDAVKMLLNRTFDIPVLGVAS